MIAGAAQAEESSERYAIIDGWEISAALDKSYCAMEKWYKDSETGGTEGLLVLYDAARESIVLTWGSSTELDVPASGYVDLAPYFMKLGGGSHAWLNRPFRHRQPQNLNYFVHVFKDPKDTRTMLRDFGKYPIFVLYQEGQPVTAIPLGSLDVVDKLEECSTKMAQSAPSHISE